MTGASSGIGFEPAKQFAQHGYDLVVAAEDDAITALMPGPTDTNFFGRAKMLDSLMGKMHKDDPAQVARQGLLRPAAVTADGRNGVRRPSGA